MPLAHERHDTKKHLSWGAPNRKGKRVFGRKCGYTGCEYRGRDHNRHTEETHVMDPVITLCCPYHGCGVVYPGGSFRCSEMERHCEEHEKQNKGEKRGRRGIMPLSSYGRP